jgi:hypothetical protein
MSHMAMWTAGLADWEVAPLLSPYQVVELVGLTADQRLAIGRNPVVVESNRQR